VETAFERFGIIIHAYCLMINHYHLIVETPRANISKAMQLVNSYYNTYYLHQHGYVGHLFQGRFKAILVERDEYLEELSRYIHLNPVRAGLTRRPDEYEWSSYRAFLGLSAAPVFLDTASTLNAFGADSETARKNYEHYVLEGLERDIDDPLKKVKNQTFLGSDEFVSRMSEKYLSGPYHISRDTQTIPRPQQVRAHTLKPSAILDRIEAYGSLTGRSARKLKIYFLRRFTQLTLDEIVNQLGENISNTAISKTISRLEKEKEDKPELARAMAKIKSEIVKEAGIG
jgi:REP element-mobilizing transposase RayT